MDELPIPAEVVEAALRAYTGNSCDCAACRKAVLRTIRAAIKAWPGMHIRDYLTEPTETVLILPLPTQENGDE